MRDVSSTTLGWFVGQIPDDWFGGPPAVTYDRDEILVVGELPEPEQAKAVDEETRAAARVARSRSDALAWCVRLVRDHEGDWIDQLRDALAHVDEARAGGPRPSTA